MKLLGFALSLRQESYNRNLINITKEYLSVHQTPFEILDLNHYDLPPYNQDLEAQGLPPKVKQLADLLSSVQGIIIASPEYNYSYPGYFKNIFDWVSRVRPMPWQGKAMLFLAASPSMAGGERGLWQLRVPFEGCGAIVYPKMFTLPLCHQAFKEKSLEDHAAHNLKELIKSFIEFTRKIA